MQIQASCAGTISSLRNDVHDWDAIADPVLVDLKIKGKPVKAVVQANRNGFFLRSGPRYWEAACDSQLHHGDLRPTASAGTGGRT